MTERFLGNPIRYKVGGKWLTIIEIARLCDKSPSCVRSRLQRGWSMKRTMTEPTRQQRIDLGDGRKVSLTYLAEQHGLKRDTIKRRLDRGMSLDEATNPDVRLTLRSYVLNGRRVTQGDMARMVGISEPAMSRRLARGMTPEQAVSTPGRKTTYNPKPKA